MLINLNSRILFQMHNIKNILWFDTYFEGANMKLLVDLEIGFHEKSFKELFDYTIWHLNSIFPFPLKLNLHEI